MTSETHPVLEKFPERKQQIVRLIELDSAFADLCDDYRLVVEEISADGDGPAGEHEAVVTELVRLRGELETEIEHWLQGAA